MTAMPHLQAALTVLSQGGTLAPETGRALQNTIRSARTIADAPVIARPADAAPEAPALAERIRVNDELRGLLDAVATHGMMGRRTARAFLDLISAEPA